MPCWTWTGWTGRRGLREGRGNPNPRRIEAITGQGRLFRIRQQYDKAMAAYERALAIDDSYAQAYSSMMVVALKQGQFDKAITHGEKAWSLDKNDPPSPPTSPSPTTTPATPRSATR